MLQLYVAQDGQFNSEPIRDLITYMVEGETLFFQFEQGRNFASNKFSLMGFTNTAYNTFQKCGFRNPKNLQNAPLNSQALAEAE